jgi:hypothetical protein
MSVAAVDEISLTLPADDAFHRVAHLVLGGLAVRHNLTYEMLDDLELALDTLLERYGEVSDEVTVRVRVGTEVVQTIVGPFLGDVRTEVERDLDDSLGLRRILEAVSDRVDVTEQDGGVWVELTRRIQRTNDEAA